MKKIALLATSVSMLCAGPMITPLVDYDKADMVEAETKVEQKLELPPVVQPEVTTPGVRKKSFNYEVDLLAGRNFADDGSLLKDATTVGIRLNRFITDTVALQIGYDRIFDADYKFGKTNRTLHNATTQNDTTHTCPPGYCCSCTPCEDDTQTPNDTTNDSDHVNGGDDNIPSDNDNGYHDDDGGSGGADANDGANDYYPDEDGSDADAGNGAGGGGANQNDGSNDGAENGNGADGSGNGAGGSDNGAGGSGNGAGGNTGNGNNGGTSGNGNGGGNPLSEKGLANATRSTDVDRFYLNVVKEIHSEKTRFIPYAFAGVGYEHVNDKNLGIDSQGFFNAGGGLKYSLGEKFRVVSEAKAIKKFSDNDLDIVAMVGLGMLFGEKGDTTLPQNPEIEGIDTIAPQPQTQDLSLVILDDTTPAAQTSTATPAPVDRTPIVQTLIAEESQSQTVPVADNAYYVQVAVVTTEKGVDSYTSKLAKSGLSYQVKPAKIGNRKAHRVLVGPYLSRTEAKRDLRKIKKIEKGAFIRQI